MPRVRFCLPSFSSFLRCCAVVLAIGACSGLQAQTAYLGQPLGGGFGTPAGVAVDGSGNVYVADVGTDAVYEIPVGCTAAAYTISPSCVTTLGGGFTNPSGVAVDGRGNVYVADGNVYAVYEIPAGCTAAAYAISPCVTTLGGGFGNTAGVAVDGSGNVYVADLTAHAVKEIPAGCTAAAYAVSPCVIMLSSSFSLPRRVAVDGSLNIYVADEGSDTVKEVLAAGGYTTVNTLGGGFNTPVDVAVDNSGNVYVADFGDDETKEIPVGCTSSSCVTTLGGGFNTPDGVAVDGSDNVYVANEIGGAVNEIVAQGVNFGSAAIATSTPVTKTLTFTFITSGTIGVPAVVTQGATGLDFTDAGTGTCTTTNGSGHTYAINSTCTVDVTFKPTKAGTRYGAVTLLNGSGTVIATAYIYGTGSGPQVAFSPATQSTVASGFSINIGGVAVDGSGNVYIGNGQGDDVVKETLSGGSYTQSTVASGFNFNIGGVAVDGSGNVYIGNDRGNDVVKETLSGGSYTQSTVASGLGGNIGGVAVDGSGNVYIGNNLGNDVIKETLSGGSYTQSTVASGLGGNIGGVAVDGSGNVYIGNNLGNDVIKETLSGGSYTQSTVASGLGGNIGGVAVDGSGNVYIGNGLGNDVIKETLSGGSYTQSTVASGLGGNIGGVAVDGSGNVYIGNGLGNDVVKEDYADAPTVAFAHTTVDGTTDSTDGAKTVTLENIGNASLSFSIPTSGNNPSMASAPDFSLNSTGGSMCPLISSTASSAGTLAAGGSCNLVVSFAPVATPPQGGALSESLVVTDTNLNANPSTTQSITLTGTAQATADYFTVTGPNPFPWYTATYITITAHNIDGSVDTGYAGSVTLTSSDPGFGNINCAAALASGTEACEVDLRTPGTQTITVSDTASGFLSGTLTTVESPGPVSSLIVSAPSSTMSGSSISVTVTAHDIFNNVVTNYTGTVSFTSTDPAAVLPASYTFVAGDAGSHTFSVTLETPGSQTITANDATNSVTGTSGLVAVNAPGYVVETASDDASGVAGNCPVGGGGTTCTLRDALAAAAAAGAGNITFSSTAFATAQSITLANGTLSIPSNTTITGATSGSGATLANLVTVNGNNATTVFTVNSGTVGTSIANLILINGNGTHGGGIFNSGTLTVASSTISGNSANSGGGGGGGIFNGGTLTVTSSTISGNSAASSHSGSGGIFNSGTLTVANSTISGNTGSITGALFNNVATLIVANSTIYGNTGSTSGILSYFSGSMLTVVNSIVAGNTGASSVEDDISDGNSAGDLDGSYSSGYGNTVGLSASQIDLAPLGNYGGPTQTMIPLLGSAAICTGSASLATNAGLTTDQRGFAIGASGYCPSGSIDAGAVQTDYALTFTGNEPGATQIAGISFPAGVTLTESGSALSGITIPLTLNGGGTLTGGSAATNASGLASYTLTATNATALTGLTLTATLPALPTLTATSTSFGLLEPVATSLTPTVTPSSSFTYSQQPSISVALIPSNATGIIVGDFTATLDTTTALTVTAGTGNTFNIALPATPLTVGAHSIAVNFTGATDYLVSNVTIPLTVTAPGYVVTTLADDATGVPANCPLPSTGVNCTLRDAVAAANAVSGGNISFASGLGSASSPGKITLLNGALSLTANATITGLGTTALVIDGNQNGNILQVGTGITVSISNLTMQNALGQNALSQLGGAIYNAGTLTLTGVLVQGSQPSTYSGGAGIYNDTTGTLTLTNSTIQNNSTSAFGGTSGLGGGILNEGGNVTITSSTLTGNAATYNGGNLDTSGGTIVIANSTITGSHGTDSGGALVVNGGTVTVTDSTIAYNTSLINPSMLVTGGTVTVTNSIVAANGSNTSTGNCPGCILVGNNIVDVDPQLSILGSYGGLTQTLVPLPGSPAICGGAATVDTTDQRGYSRSTGSCYDVGAVQTKYSMAFVQQPSSTVQFAAMTPAPTVQLEENGNPFTGGSVSIPLTLSSGTGNLTGGVVSTSTTGLSTYSVLSIDTPGTGDQLTAAVVLNPAITPTLSISATSSSFNITPAVSQLAFATPPASTLTAGGNASTVTVQEETSGGTLVTGAADAITLNVTGPNGYAETYQETASGGIATFNLSSATLTAIGAYSYKATSGSLTQAVASETVDAASASSISVVSGSGQNAVIGTAFGAALTVKVVDAYSNPVSAVTATFTAPTNGASATLSASTCSTAADGTCSVTATANGLASTTAYTVSAKVSGVSASSSFTLTNTQQSTTLTVTPTATALTYGQPVTINASIHPSSVLTSVPTGNITFYDGTTTALTPNAVVSGAAASDTVAAPLSGTHTYYATYNGDSNFAASTQTAATANVVVGKASATLTGPVTQPVLVTAQQSTTISVTIAGQFSGTGITPPSGQISYSILNASNTSVANGTLTIASSNVTVPVGNTLAVGSYTVNVSYQGDTNYSASTAPTTIALQVGQIQPTISWAQPAAISYGTTLAGVLNASAMNGSSTVAGTYSYAVGATSVIATAVLPASATAYTLTVSFTPTDATTYKTATGSVSLTVNRTAVGGITLTSSVNPILVDNATTLTATVTSAVSIPTGSVSFYDSTSSTPLGTVALVNGVAALPVSTLAVGTHSITAIYSGDSNFLTATSAAVSEQVEDFNINLAAGGNIVIPPGGTASYNFTVSPVGSSTLPAGVALSVSGLPPGATYTFTPSTIATGSGATSVLLKISVPQEVGSLQHNKGFGNGLAPIAFGLLLLPFSRRLRKSAGKMGRITIALLLLMAGAAGIAGLTGCGSSNGFLAQPQQSYTLTITGTSGALTHSATAVLTVE